MLTGWLLSAALLVAPPGDETHDLQAARALFERNIAAIQERDREAYLACYLPSDALVRTGPTGMQFGWDDLASGTPPSDSDDWPWSLEARDLQLARVRDGVVYGTYRYHVIFERGGPAQSGLSERVFVETDDGWRIAVSTAFPQPEGTPPPPVALVGATLWDGTGAAPLHDAALLVRDGRIEALGPRDAVTLPDGVDVIDLTGRWIVPGLVDTHVHYSQSGWVDARPGAFDVRERFPYEQVVAGLAAHPERQDRAYLASGITAVFDVGGYPFTRGLGARNERSTEAPHVAAAGPLLSTWVPDQLNQPDRVQMLLMQSEDGVRAAVRSHVAAGSDAIKIWYIVRRPDDVQAARPLVLAAGDEARAQGVPLIVHATGLAEARVAVEAGAKLLVHSVDDAPVDAAFVQACLDAGTSYCPTLIVADGYEHLDRGLLPESVSEGFEWVHPQVVERVRLTTGLPDRVTDPEQRVARDARLDARRALMAANLRTLHAAGVPVALGTDAGNPLTLHGPSVFLELEAMQAAGLSAQDVLLASTRDAAAAMGRGDDFGRLLPGMLADLVVLEANPLDDVANLRAITHVMRGGLLHDRERLRPADG